MPFVRRSAVLVPATLIIMAATGFEPMVRQKLNLGSGDHQLTIGAVRVPLWSAALAEVPGSLKLEDVSISTGTATYTMKRIDFSGVTSSEADIRALFDGGSSEPLGVRLAKLGAKQVSIPEIIAEERIGALRQRTVFRNVVATDIERGRIRLLRADGSTAETTGPAPGSLVQNQNGLTATDTDLAALARIYAQKAGADPEPMTKILGSYTVESSVFTDGAGDTTKVGRTVVRDLFMRPTEESWTALASLVWAISELDKPSDKDTLRVLSAALDAANAVQVGLVEANGIEATGKAKDQTFGLAIRRSAYQSATQTHPADARVEGIEFRMPEGTAKVDAISYTGFSFQPTLEGLRALRGKLTDKMDDLDSATIRSLIPTIGTIRYTGLSFDGRIPRENRTDRERLQISLGEAEFTAEKSRNGIPTHVRIAVRNLAFPLPADGKEESLKPMLDLGYKALNISGSLSATWNEAKQEILLTDVSLGGTEMGQIAMKGVIGGVKPDVFNLDTAVATAAALSATARSVEIAVENGGLFDRYLQQEAGKQKKAPEALRREYGAAAALAVPVMLGNSDQAKALGQAVARFIAKPNRLRITARTKNPAGLGLTDLMVLSDPAAALEKLEISVTTD